MTVVERKKMITSAMNKSESNLEVGKVLWKFVSPGFAAVCTDGKDWLWHMVCHETLWRVWNWSYRLRKQTSCCL